MTVMLSLDLPALLSAAASERHTKPGIEGGVILDGECLRVPAHTDGEALHEGVLAEMIGHGRPWCETL